MTAADDYMARVIAANSGEGCGDRTAELYSQASDAICRTFWAKKCGITRHDPMRHTSDADRLIVTTVENGGTPEGHPHGRGREVRGQAGQRAHAEAVPQGPRHRLGHLAPVRRATLPAMRRLLITVVALALAGCGDSGDGTGSVQASTTAQSARVATTAARTATTGASGRVQYAAALQEIEACYLSSEFTSSSVQQSAEALNGLTPPSGFELRHRELITELLAASRLTSVAQGSAVGTAGAHMDNLAREADPGSQNPTPGRCAGLTPPVPRTR